MWCNKSEIHHREICWSHFHFHFHFHLISFYSAGSATIRCILSWVVNWCWPSSTRTGCGWQRGQGTWKRLRSLAGKDEGRKVLAPVVSQVFTQHYYFAVHCRLCIFSLSALRAGTKAAQAAQATGWMSCLPWFFFVTPLTLHAIWHYLFLVQFAFCCNYPGWRSLGADFAAFFCHLHNLQAALAFLRFFKCPWVARLHFFYSLPCTPDENEAKCILS